jgi:MFS transporter, DHA1 family, tetracycline resistance protein
MWRQGGIGFILVMVFVDSVGLGLIIPLEPQIISLFTEAPSQTALYMGLLVTLGGALQFIFSPIIGSLSDRYGRRPVIIFSLIGSLCDFLIFALAPSLIWLVLGRVIGGITNAWIPTLNAYIADVSESENLTRNYGLLGVIFGVGFIVGPALGGLLGSFGLRLPYFIVAALTFINLLYAIFLLPESLPKEKRKVEGWKLENPLSSYKLLQRYPLIVNLASVLVVMALTDQILYVTWSLYTQTRFSWNTAESGLSLTVFGLAGAIVEGLLVAWIVKRLGQKRSIVSGLIFIGVSYIMFGLASQGWMIYAVIPLFAFGSVYGSAIQGLIGSSVPSSEQGTVQGAIASLTSITQIIGPLLGGSLLSYFLSEDAFIKIPGFTFLLAAVLAFVAVSLAVRAFGRNGATTNP